MTQHPTPSLSDIFHALRHPPGGRNVYEAAWIWAREAIRTAELRRADHDRNGNTGHWGDPEDIRDEYFGSLGQIVFREHCRDLGLPIESGPLFVPNIELPNHPGWDARIAPHTIEVKAVPPDGEDGGRIVRRRLLLVKKRENHNSDYYVAVKFESATRYWFAGFATRDEVLAAPEFSKFAPAFSIPLEKLHRISSAPWMSLVGKDSQVPRP